MSTAIFQWFTAIVPKNFMELLRHCFLFVNNNVIESKWKAIRLLNLMLKTIFFFSFLPLRKS